MYIGHATYMISRLSHISVQFNNNCTCNNRNVTWLALCNYFTVTGTIIHSNVCGPTL